MYHRDEKRSFLLAADYWNDAFLSLKTLFMQGMSGKSTSSSAKVDFCSDSAPPSVVTVTDSDISEPAMAVFLSIASSGEYGAEESDDYSVTQENVE